MTRIVQVGASYTSLCGVRSWADVLQDHLAEGEVGGGPVWWERSDNGAYSSSTLAELRRWRSAVEEAVARTPADTVVVWSYAAFCYGFRGLPVFVPGISWWMGTLDRPVVVVMHEFAYPWRGRGPKGAVLAATSRAALVAVVRSATAVVVTTEARLDWLRAQRWLPRRPSAFVPIFATLPGRGPGIPRVTGQSPLRVGVFASGSDPIDCAPVAVAVATLRDRGEDVRLVLLGSDHGAAGGRSRLWRDALAAVGHEDAVEGTGRLTPEALAAAIDAVDVLVSAERDGPSSRKTTLASALARGACIVALRGPELWPSLERERAVTLVGAEAGAVTAALASFLGDGAARAEQGQRARAFAVRHLDPRKTVERVLTLAGDARTSDPRTGRKSLLPAPH